MEFREQITIGAIYFVFAYFATLGFWQLVAAWQRMRALSWLGRRVKAKWGYALGSAFISLACLWFFGTRSYEIFSPGPASSEFLFFLVTALLCSLITTVLVSTLLHGASARTPAVGQNTHANTKPVSFEGGYGVLYLPPSGNGLCPAICMVSAPGEGLGSLETIAVRLSDAGFIVLAANVTLEDSWLYPDILALFPRAVAYLEGRADVDASRIGALGVELGGDLAVRAAASDRQIAAVAVLAPLLVEASARPGLDLLREMSFTAAVRWTHVHRGGKLVAQLGALDHISELGSRPLLVIYGEEDALAPLGEMKALRRRGKLELISGQGRQGLVYDPDVIRSTTRWFRRHL
jgi:pimeloyl-ACP methyl ester carboxylesterase